MTTDVLDALTVYFPWILPECALALFACVLFLGSTWKADRHLWGAVALVGVAVAVLLALFIPRPTFSANPEQARELVRKEAEENKEALNPERENELVAQRTTQLAESRARTALFVSPVWLDKLAVYIKLLGLIGVGILILFSWDEVGDRLAAEYHACLLVIAAGVGLTGAANDLVLLFLALELISIPTYIILYLPRSDDAAQEAGAKYFLLSIFSSGMMLFGFSYLYGLTGTTNLQAIASAFNAPGAGGDLKSGVALIALVMIVAGLGFKITAVPFHFYAPDVYQGTTTGIAALLAYVPKVAGFVALMRVFGMVAPDLRGGGAIARQDLATLLWIIAAVTMTLGNVLALLQDNLKRMLAYSSVAHSGYMLVGLAVAVSPQYANSVGRGTDAVLFYLVAYGAMTIGAFAVIEFLSTKQRPVENVDDLAGLSKSHPGIALVMALFLFSLIGLPPTPGFFGKWQLLWDAFSLKQSDPSWEPSMTANAVKQASLFRILALIMVLNAAVGSWYYLRIIAAMYLRTPLQPLAKPKTSPRLVALGLCAAITLVFFYPRPLFDRARAAVVDEVQFEGKKADAPR